MAHARRFVVLRGACVACTGRHTLGLGGAVAYWEAECERAVGRPPLLLELLAFGKSC